MGRSAGLGPRSRCRVALWQSNIRRYRVSWLRRIIITGCNLVVNNHTAIQHHSAAINYVTTTMQYIPDRQLTDRHTDRPSIGSIDRNRWQRCRPMIYYKPANVHQIASFLQKDNFLGGTQPLPSMEETPFLVPNPSWFLPVASLAWFWLRPWQRDPILVGLRFSFSHVTVLGADFSPADRCFNVMMSIGGLLRSVSARSVRHSVLTPYNDDIHPA